jgi:drug/metabolite transporter (DMT)-like permease
MQRPTLAIWRYQRAVGLYAIDPGRLTTRSVTIGAALIVGSALAFALDGPMAQAAYQQGLDPAAFGFWRAMAGAVALGGILAIRPRPGVLAGIRRMRRADGIRLALAAMAGLGLNLALFQAFARLPVAVAVAAFGCYPLLVAAWEVASRQRSAGAVRLGLATVAVIGLVLLIRPDPSVSVPAARLLLALLAAVLHAAYIVLSRDGWGEIGDGVATFLIVATAAAGLGVLAAVTRLAGRAWHPAWTSGSPRCSCPRRPGGRGRARRCSCGLRRIGATQTAVLSLCEPLATPRCRYAQPVAYPSQLLGAALLVGAGVAVQVVPGPSVLARRPGRRVIRA